MNQSQPGNPAETMRKTQRAVAPDALAEVIRRYHAMRAVEPIGMPITVLHIGADETAVATGTETTPEAALVPAMGSGKTSTEQFRHRPPTAGEMENAIQVVEDEVSRARKMIADGTALFTTDPAIRAIARAAGVPDQPEMTLPLDALEQVFARLAAGALGAPAGREDLSADAGLAATVLILREFMHHMPFRSITIPSPDVEGL